MDDTNAVAPDSVSVGDYLAWRTWTGDAAVVKVFHVGPFRVSYEDSDGCLGSFEASIFRSLATCLQGVRRATPEEIATFEAYARPWEPIQ